MVSTLASHLFLTAVATVFVSPRVAGAIRCAVCDSTVQAGIGMNNYQQNTMDQSCFGTGGQVAPLKTCADSHPYCITLTKYNYDEYVWPANPTITVTSPFDVSGSGYKTWDDMQSKLINALAEVLRVVSAKAFQFL